MQSFTERRRLHITPLALRSRRARGTRFSRSRGIRRLVIRHESPVERRPPDSDDWEDIRTSKPRVRSATPEEVSEGGGSSDSSDRRSTQSSTNDSPRVNPRITDSIAPSPVNRSSSSSDRGSRDADDEAVDDDVYDGPLARVTDRRASQASNPRLHLALQRPMPTALVNRTANGNATAAPPSIAEAASRAAAALAGASPQRSRSAAASNRNLPPGVVRAVGPNTRNLGNRVSSGHTRKNKKGKDGSLSLHLRWRPDGYVTLSEGSSTNTTPGMLTPVPRDNDPQHREQHQEKQQEKQQEIPQPGPAVRGPSPSPSPSRRSSGEEDRSSNEESEKEEQGKIPHQNGHADHP
ncbi:hypothetical protein VTH06DRAFT_1781 [Thermothelomyces fergusii]